MLKGFCPKVLIGVYVSGTAWRKSLRGRRSTGVAVLVVNFLPLGWSWKSYTHANAINNMVNFRMFRHCAFECFGLRNSLTTPVGEHMVSLVIIFAD